MQYVGLRNYKFILHDLAFWGSVANTAYFAFAFLIFEIPFSLGLAVALNSRKVKCRSLLRFAFLSSHFVGNVFVSILFGFLLAPRHGLVNKAIGTVFPAIGTETQWTSKPALAMPAMVLTALWLAVGYAMIYFLAALQNVEPELYEAAAVDGATRWQKFRNITLPGIMPVVRYLVLVGLVSAFQMFELPYILFNQTAGPAGRGITIVMYLYLMGFNTGDLGYASAVGWMLVLILILLSILLMLLQWRAIRSFANTPRTAAGL